MARHAIATRVTDPENGDLENVGIVDSAIGPVIVGYNPWSTLYEIRDNVTGNILHVASSIDAIIDILDGAN